MKNETYDILSWISSPLIPALVALILTLGKTWEIPYYIQIGASISAVGVFLEALLRKSSKKYYQELGTNTRTLATMTAPTGTDTEEGESR